ncbi:PREDICTED: uncharacterized protein LOC108512303 [Rhinopithecus bieti]|uniref:uncharacterized protein LOC108512303 n=1 Tax=Rhinopithecus bieti TaxID=61621 RepID=UPI00083BFCAC|nr:PREDICTED: uncharacterized protein LOC108512303 [Rhinopithecus bieti]
MDEWMDGMGQVVGADALEVGYGPTEGEVMRVSSGHTDAQGALATQLAALQTTDLPSGAACRAAAEMPCSITAAAAAGASQDPAPSSPGRRGRRARSRTTPGARTWPLPTGTRYRRRSPRSRQGGRGAEAAPRGRRAAPCAGPSIAGSYCASDTWQLCREEKRRGWTWVPLTWTDTSMISMRGLLDLFSFPSCTLKNGSEPEEPQDSAKTDTQHPLHARNIPEPGDTAMTKTEIPDLGKQMF